MASPVKPIPTGYQAITPMLTVRETEKAFNWAISAGAMVLMPVADMFWGDRCGQVLDPFGHKWMLATRKEDLSPEAIQKRGAAFFAQTAQAGKPCS